MKLYLAGPMRGLPLYNFPAFFAAAIELRQRGYTVHNPAEHDMAEGFQPHKPLTAQEPVFNLGDALNKDSHLILDSDGIVLLPDWEDSVGAKFERCLCAFTGRKVFLYARVLGDPLLTDVTAQGTPDILYPKERFETPTDY